MTIDLQHGAIPGPGIPRPEETVAPPENTEEYQNHPNLIVDQVVNNNGVFDASHLKELLFLVAKKFDKGATTLADLSDSRRQLVELDETNPNVKAFMQGDELQIADLGKWEKSFGDSREDITGFTYRLYIAAHKYCQSMDEVETN